VGSRAQEHEQKTKHMLDLSHKNLNVYKISLKLVEEIYKATRTFPKEELYVLVSQTIIRMDK